MAVLTDPQAEVQAPQPEAITPIKLSEAMRLGSLITTKFTHHYRDTIPPTAACAMGAAWIGAGSKGEIHDFAAQFADIKSSYPCKHYKGQVEDGWNIVSHLNDSCGWSRERIADWLESIGY